MRSNCSGRWRAGIPTTVRDGRDLLAQTLAERAETFMRRGHHTEALADFEEVVELTKSVKDGELFRAFHALTKARLGDLSALALLANEVRDTVKHAGHEGRAYYSSYFMASYDVACLHAALARLALQDQGKPLAERQQLAQQDLDRTLELLDKARATGEFKGMIRLEEVRREPLLDLLRSNPRLQLLKMDLAFPDNPFGAQGKSP